MTSQFKCVTVHVMPMNTGSPRIPWHTFLCLSMHYIMCSSYYEQYVSCMSIFQHQGFPHKSLMKGILNVHFRTTELPHKWLKYYPMSISIHQGFPVSHYWSTYPIFISLHQGFHVSHYWSTHTMFISLHQGFHVSHYWSTHTMFISLHQGFPVSHYWSTYPMFISPTPRLPLMPLLTSLLLPISYTKAFSQAIIEVHIQC